MTNRIKTILPLGAAGSKAEGRPMAKLGIYGHNVEITPDLHSYVERQVSALWRFGRRVRSITVRLHAGTGDAMTSCHIALELHPSGGLDIGEAGPNLRQIIDRAGERAGRALGRELARLDAPARTPGVAGMPME